jgi:uncharacterized protein (TIGR02246 family)
MKRLMVAVALLAAFPATLHAQIVMRVDASVAGESASELTAVRADYVALVNSGDAARLTSLYTADALITLGDGSRLSGTAEIAQHFARTFEPAARRAMVTLVPQRIEIGGAGELGAESGTFLEAADGSLVSGAYVTIYSRGGDGRWRIVIDVRTTGAQLPAVTW